MKHKKNLFSICRFIARNLIIFSIYVSKLIMLEGRKSVVELIRMLFVKCKISCEQKSSHIDLI